MYQEMSVRWLESTTRGQVVPRRTAIQYPKSKLNRGEPLSSWENEEIRIRSIPLSQCWPSLASQLWDRDTKYSVDFWIPRHKWWSYERRDHTIHSAGVLFGLDPSSSLHCHCATRPLAWMVEGDNKIIPTSTQRQRWCLMLVEERSHCTQRAFSAASIHHPQTLSPSLSDDRICQFILPDLFPIFHRKHVVLADFGVMSNVGRLRAVHFSVHLPVPH